MKLTVYRDNTPTIQLQVFHDDGSKVNLTGCTALVCAKTDQSLPNSAALFTKSTGGLGVVITDPNNGILQFTLATVDTQALTDTTVVDLDCLITDVAGNVYTVANTTTLEVKANFSRK